MNILLTSAGRRNYLLHYFKEALDNNGRVFAADASSEAPVLQEADRAFVVPLVKEEGYFDVLYNICKEHKVRLLLSLNDLELPLLAREKERFLAIDTIPVISSPEVVDTCFDKWKMVQLLKRLGLKVPNTFLTLQESIGTIQDKQLSFPLVIKPRWGTASIGIEYPEDEEELKLAYSLTRKRLERTLLADISATDKERSLLIQERLNGQEYGLDVINDLKGKYVCTYVKKKLAMRAGETDRAMTVKDRELEGLGQRIGEGLGHVGNLDCDVFVNDEGVYVLEMNPRFGGGYPFSHVAGTNIPAALVAWAGGKKPDPDWFKVKEGVKSGKCDRIIVLG